MSRKLIKPKKPVSSRDWSQLLQLIPGYDSTATAAPGDWFDPIVADKYVDFFSTLLTHIEGALASKPFVLEPWQQAIVGALFGWRRRHRNGAEIRRYRECLIYVPRKNGKTPLAAGICNAVMFLDGEMGAQGYALAGDREQASLLFRQARGQIENEPELSKRAEIYGGEAGTQRRIVFTDTHSFIVVGSADSDTKHGGNSHLVAIDELHVQPGRELVDTVRTSFASANRLQPLLLMITTADYHRESICNETYDYATKVRDRLIDDSQFLPVIYEVPEDADWTSEETWALANPNLNVSVSIDYLRRECARAKETPAYENTFRRLHLNQRTRQETRWLNMQAWQECAAKFDPATLEGRRCYGGLDLSSKLDLSAFVLVFPPITEGGPYYVLPWFWIPAEGAQQKEKTDRVPYATWIKQGLVRATPGALMDFDVVEKDLKEICRRYRPVEVAFDKWNCQQLATGLSKEGLTMVDLPMTITHLTAGTKLMGELVTARRLAHPDHPVLTWNAECVTVTEDKNLNIRPVKPERKTGKRIDGVMAAVVAMCRCAVNGGQQPSVYESRGVEVL